MWTAKRILILGGGLLVCLGGFVVYSLALGDFANYPHLPEAMLRDPNGVIEKIGLENVPDKKLALAFGAGSEELRRPLRLWLPDKGVVFSAGDFTIDNKGNGVVRLAPFSAAIFHKSKNGGHPEVSTLRSDVAILTLNRPVTSHSELANRKVIAVELQGGRPGVTLTNNRGTAEKTDDIDVLIINGSLFYEEKKNLIWTEGVVCVTDHSTKLPTIIRGKHMEMFLAKETNPNQPKVKEKAPRKNGNPDAGNIEKIIVHSDVEMRFWVDARAGFLGGVQNARDARPIAPVPEDPNADKAQVIVKSGGMFVYDLTKEFAWFESPPPREDKVPDPNFPDQVHVQRNQKINGKEVFDQLTCDRLELQFRQKIAANGAAAVNASNSNKEIDTAKATARPGNDVALALDSERVAAHGSEFHYTAPNLVNGPLMVLKGEPLLSNKDGHMMKCKELHLTGADRFGEGQKVKAFGPGQIDLLDGKNPEKAEFPTHVLWRDTLHVGKVKEGGLTFDLITVEGTAAFIDDQQKQQLNAEKIMVWLKSRQDGARHHQQDVAAAHGQDLHRVFAQGNVRANSPEFGVRQANTMTMTFLAAAARNDRLPDARPPAPGVVIEDKKVAAIPKKAPDEKKFVIEEKKPAKTPIELQANDITAIVSSIGTKQLHELIARGNVFVFQAGEKPGDKKIDITGQLLTVNKISEKGDKLVVHGDKKTPARMQLGDITLYGALVTIDQDKNKADVDSDGIMEMPTNKNLDGTDAGNQKGRLRVHWNKNMTFDGKIAVFSGGVKARALSEKGEELPSWLLCQEMFTVLDKTVSFKDNKEGDKASNAKVDRIVCHGNVFIDDSKTEEPKQPGEKKRLVQRNVVEGSTLTHQDYGGTKVTGPGQIRLLAKSGGEFGLAPPPPGAPNQPPKMEWKVTSVKFYGSLHARTVGAAKTAKFYWDHANLVEVCHFPSIDILAKMNPDQPPKDGMYLRCEMLEVEERQHLGRVAHTMIARNNVYFRTDQHQGYADILKYDEANDTIIFEATGDKFVRLYRVTNNGLVPESVNAQKVLYNRKTQKLETEGVKSIGN